MGRDTRNSRIFPDAGRLQMLSTEITLPMGDLKYWKVDFDHRYYFKLPFRKKWTLILKNKIGYGDSYGSTQELPFFRNFFAGGPRTVRGYGESSLGPEDIFGRALGGNILLTGNAEVIVPVPSGDIVIPPFVFLAEIVFPFISKLSIVSSDCFLSAHCGKKIISFSLKFLNFNDSLKPFEEIKIFSQFL